MAASKTGSRTTSAPSAMAAMSSIEVGSAPSFMVVVLLLKAISSLHVNRSGDARRRHTNAVFASVQLVGAQPAISNHVDAFMLVDTAVHDDQVFGGQRGRNGVKTAATSGLTFLAEKIGTMFCAGKRFRESSSATRLLRLIAGSLEVMSAASIWPFNNAESVSGPATSRVLNDLKVMP